MTGQAPRMRSKTSGGRAAFEVIDRHVGNLGRVLSVGGAISACLIMVLMAVDVGYRNLFNQSIAGTFEVVEVALVLAVFLGMATAERSGAAVRVTLFTAMLPPRGAAVVRLIGLLVSLGIVVWFAYASIDKALHSFAIGEYKRGIISFPMWPGRAVIALGFSMLALELTVGVLRRLIALSDGPQAVEAPLPDAARKDGPRSEVGATGVHAR